MRAYVIRRLLLVIPTVFLVSLIVFLLIRLVPGDAVDALVAQLAEFDPGTNIEEIRVRLSIAWGWMYLSLLSMDVGWGLFPKMIAVSGGFFKVTWANLSGDQIL